jgi:hypothetical protein
VQVEQLTRALAALHADVNVAVHRMVAAGRTGTARQLGGLDVDPHILILPSPGPVGHRDLGE